MFPVSLRLLPMAVVALEPAFRKIQVPDDDVRHEIDANAREDGGKQVERHRQLRDEHPVIERRRRQLRLLGELLQQDEIDAGESDQHERQHKRQCQP